VVTSLCSSLPPAPNSSDNSPPERSQSAGGCSFDPPASCEGRPGSDDGGSAATAAARLADQLERLQREQEQQAVRLQALQAQCDRSSGP
jgi:hypothetical protein